jgi:hypothetical protein
VLAVAEAINVRERPPSVVAKDAWGQIQGKREGPKADLLGASPFSATGGSVKAEGLGDGSTHAKAAIAKLRLTMLPIMSRKSVTPVWEKLNQARLVIALRWNPFRLDSLPILIILSLQRSLVARD